MTKINWALALRQKLGPYSVIRDSFSRWLLLNFPHKTIYQKWSLALVAI